MNPDIPEIHTHTVLVPPHGIKLFEKKMEKLNKKAHRFGLPPIRIVSRHSEFFRQTSEAVGRGRDKQLIRLIPAMPDQDRDLIELWAITLNYPMVRLGHWQVVALIERLDIGNLVFTFTANPHDQAYAHSLRHQAMHCQHCHTRRERKSTFVLRDLNSGGHTQVGSSCLRDYTGTDPAAALFLARMSQVLSQDGDQDRGQGTNGIGVRPYLADVLFLIGESGFVSAQQARDQGTLATFDLVLGLARMTDADQALGERYRDALPTNLAQACEIIDWYAALDPTSDFDQNVKQLLAEPVLRIKCHHLAFVAAAVWQWVKKQREQALLASHPRQYLGTPKARLCMRLTVCKVLLVDNPYSRFANNLIILEDQQHNQLKWLTGAAPHQIVHGKGKTFDVSFKVKAHEVYRDVPQTVITHLKLLGE